MDTKMAFFSKIKVKKPNLPPKHTREIVNTMPICAHLQPIS